MRNVISDIDQPPSAEPRGPGPWRLHQDELPWEPDARGGQNQILPAAAGEGSSRLVQLEPGLSLIETCYRPRRDFAISSRIESAEPRLVLTLALAGRSGFHGQSGEAMSFCRGHSTVTSFESSRGERRYAGGETVRQLRLSIAKPWLEAHVGEPRTAGLFGDREVRLLSHRPASCAGLLAAEQLLHGPPAEALGGLYLRGQALALLAAELAPLFAEEGRGADRREGQDRLLALRARDILRAEHARPPSVAVLARRLGTNEFKLKLLLHRYLQSTPYGIVTETRMETAYRLLESGLHRVSEVADRVGYTHPGNFSAAFSRYFGFPPKAVGRGK